MTQLDIVKSFLQDTEIGEKYGLSPTDLAQMTLQSQYTGKTQVLVQLVRRMAEEMEKNQPATPNVVASILNKTLETALGQS